MQPLRLSPLPTLRNEAESDSLRFEQQGFVDELKLPPLMARPGIQRSMAKPADLALAAEEMEFAGWSFDAPAQPARSMTSRRATPPVMTEPGLGEPHQGSHRWWLAGLAGVFSTILFSALLLNLSARSTNHFEAVIPPGMFAPAKRVEVTKQLPAPAAPELTGSSWRQH